MTIRYSDENLKKDKVFANKMKFAQMAKCVNCPIRLACAKYLESKNNLTPDGSIITGYSPRHGQNPQDESEGVSADRTDNIRVLLEDCPLVSIIGRSDALIASMDKACKDKKERRAKVELRYLKRMKMEASVKDYLVSIGADSSDSNIFDLAREKGITGYTGSIDQNTQLLSSLRNAGKLNKLIE